MPETNVELNKKLMPSHAVDWQNLQYIQDFLLQVNSIASSHSKRTLNTGRF